MSAVLKSKSIETIFDYNLNDAELVLVQRDLDLALL